MDTFLWQHTKKASLWQLLRGFKVSRIAFHASRPRAPQSLNSSGSLKGWNLSHCPLGLTWEFQKTRHHKNGHITGISVNTIKKWKVHIPSQILTQMCTLIVFPQESSASESYIRIGIYAVQMHSCLHHDRAELEQTCCLGPRRDCLVVIARPSRAVARQWLGRLGRNKDRNKYGRCFLRVALFCGLKGKHCLFLGNPLTRAIPYHGCSGPRRDIVPRRSCEQAAVTLTMLCHNLKALLHQ